MAKVNLTALKSKFETGDKPTGADFVDLIDTLEDADALAAEAATRAAADTLLQTNIDNISVGSGGSGLSAQDAYKLEVGRLYKGLGTTAVTDSNPITAGLGENEITDLVTDFTYDATLEDASRYINLVEDCYLINIDSTIFPLGAKLIFQNSNWQEHQFALVNDAGAVFAFINGVAVNDSSSTITLTASSGPNDSSENIVITKMQGSKWAITYSDGLAAPLYDTTNFDVPSYVWDAQANDTVENLQFQVNNLTTMVNELAFALYQKKIVGWTGYEATQV